MEMYNVDCTLYAGQFIGPRLEGWIQTRKIDEVHVIQGDILDGHASAKQRRKAVTRPRPLGLE